MTVITNTGNLLQYESRFSLIVELILVFDSIPNMVRKVKYLPPNFKQIEASCFTLLNIFNGIVREILSLNSKQFHQKL